MSCPRVSTFRLCLPPPPPPHAPFPPTSLAAPKSTDGAVFISVVVALCLVALALAAVVYHLWSKARAGPGGDEGMGSPVSSRASVLPLGAVSHPVIPHAEGQPMDHVAEHVSPPTPACLL